MKLLLLIIVRHLDFHVITMFCKTYPCLSIKGLGDAQRIDEAFQLLELVEKGNAVGNAKLSAPMISGLLNSLIGTGKL